MTFALPALSTSTDPASRADTIYEAPPKPERAFQGPGREPVADLGLELRARLGRLLRVPDRVRFGLHAVADHAEDLRRVLLPARGLQLELPDGAMAMDGEETVELGHEAPGFRLLPKPSESLLRGMLDQQLGHLRDAPGLPGQGRDPAAHLRGQHPLRARAEERHRVGSQRRDPAAQHLLEKAHPGSEAHGGGVHEEGHVANGIEERGETQKDMETFAAAFSRWDSQAIWGGSFVTKESF